jgi:NhaA family Na+:H+ antiporter
MNLTIYFNKFFKSNQSSGILLIFCVAIALIIANSSFSENFSQFLDRKIGIVLFNLKYPVSIWINDGLMAIFFLLVGLEIKRELLEGELATFKKASLPIFAAIGGMVVPALIFFLFNFKTEFSSGWGIPMATDIAFSLAIISLLGDRIPGSIKVFLAALAIVDDLGAILVIAFFYTDQIHWVYLIASFAIVGLLAIMNYLKVEKLILFLIPGVFLWYFLHHSGIHATIAGVLLAFTIPTNDSKVVVSPLEKLEHRLNLPVNFFIMPIFALANTNIRFEDGMMEGLGSTLGLGIIIGLVAGKFLGINLLSFLAVKLKISSLPQNSSWMHMSGVGLLAGIGFTMSIFIALLSFKNHINFQNEAKFAILIASLIAAVSGYLVLKFSPIRKRRKLQNN